MRPRSSAAGPARRGSMDGTKLSRRCRGIRWLLVRCWAPLLFAAACVDRRPDVLPGDEDVGTRASQQQVLTYRTCSHAAPGELVALERTIPAGTEPLQGALAELVEGVSSTETAMGCTSFFTPDTRSSVVEVRRSVTGDTVTVDFDGSIRSIPDVPGARSFLPPGVMAELTWTVFHQFQDVQALRLLLEGDEQEFWRWLAGPGGRVQVFTRADWEQI